ncbi:zinc finger CCCH domain-containing protein 26, partial [Planoprotostelium fungivorum]
MFAFEPQTHMSSDSVAEWLRRQTANLLPSGARVRISPLSSWRMNAPTATSTPNNSNNPTRVKFCHTFAANQTCRFGANCRYSHQIPASNNGSSPIDREEPSKKPETRGAKRSQPPVTTAQHATKRTQPPLKPIQSTVKQSQPPQKPPQAITRHTQPPKTPKSDQIPSTNDANSADVPKREQEEQPPNHKTYLQVKTNDRGEPSESSILGLFEGRVYQVWKRENRGVVTYRLIFPSLEE